MSSSTTLVLPSIPVAPATDLSTLWANTNVALQQMNRQIQQLSGGLTVTKTGVTQNGTTGGTGVSIYPLAANSVDTIQLVDTSVINSKIAANAVATANILDTAITTLKIANSAVTSAQVAVNTITGGLTGNLASATITAYNITASTITASQIAASTILGSNIAAATITGGNIAALTITASNIAANTITASQIAAGTITSNEIATGTIVANNIAAATITAAKLNIGDLSAITGTFTGSLTIASTNRVLATNNASFLTWQGPSGANTAGFYTQQDAAGGGYSAYGTGAGSPSIGLYRSSGSYGSPTNLSADTLVASVFVQGYLSGAYNEVGKFSWGTIANSNTNYFKIEVADASSSNIRNWLFNYDGKLYFLANNDVFSPNSGLYAAPYVSDPNANLYRSATGTIRTDGTFVVGSDLVIQNQNKLYLNNGGAPSVYLRESWGANVVGDSTHPLRLDSCALALGTFNASGSFTAGQIYFDTSAYLYISAGALHYHGSSGTDTLIAPA